MSIWKRLKKYDKIDLDQQAEEHVSGTEKGDIISMILSALLTLWLPTVLILVGLCVVVMLLFRVL